MIPKTHDQWTVFWVCTALLIVCGYAVTRNPGVRAWLAGQRAYWLTPVFAAPAGRHAGRNLPRPEYSSAKATLRDTGPGQPGWVEDDAATETWLHGLHNDEEQAYSYGLTHYTTGTGHTVSDNQPVCGARYWGFVAQADARQEVTCPDCLTDDTLTGTAELDYDAPVPADPIVAVPIAPGVYVPNLGHDDTLIDFGDQPRSGPAAWHTARNNPRVSCSSEPEWMWNGETHVLLGYTALPPWLQYECTRPLLAIEGAVA